MQVLGASAWNILTLFYFKNSNKVHKKMYDRAQGIVFYIRGMSCYSKMSAVLVLYAQGVTVAHPPLPHPPASFNRAAAPYSFWPSLQVCASGAHLWFFPSVMVTQQG
jgi:hypothetical protein